MTKEYLSRISHSYVCKNSLEKAVLKILQDFDRQKFSDLDHFQNSVTLAIEFAIVNNPRCKRIEAYWDNSPLNEREDYVLRLPGICNFEVYEIKDSWD